MYTDVYNIVRGCMCVCVCFRTCACVCECAERKRFFLLMYSSVRFSGPARGENDVESFSSDQARMASSLASKSQIDIRGTYLGNRHV